jgi:hypothetical protein
MTDVSIHGSVAAGFEPVRDAFERNFTDHGEVGASCCVVVDGTVVVDLWGGRTDRDGGRPWTADTLVNVYSSTKGLTALCANILADQGLLDLEAPVVDVWPEFGQAGKATMPVRYLLIHQAGLPVVDEELPEHAVLDWDRMVTALEHQEPVWEPGCTQGYHAVTFGWLVGEVVRRVAGTDTFGEALRSSSPDPWMPTSTWASTTASTTGWPGWCAMRRGARRARPVTAPRAGAARSCARSSRRSCPPTRSPCGPSGWRRRRTPRRTTTLAGDAPRCRRPTGTATRVPWLACTGRSHGAASSTGSASSAPRASSGPRTSRWGPRRRARHAHPPLAGVHASRAGPA